MNEAMDLTNLWIAIAAAVGYGLIGFMQAWLDHAEPRPNPLEFFDLAKIGATVIVSIVIGLIATATGIGVTKEYWIAQMGLYGWLTVLIEKFLKGVLGNKWIGHDP